MPGGDRTGPMGAGPRTGRAAGFCAGFGAPGYMNPAPGAGFAAGWGGFGWRGAGRGGMPWGGGRGRAWGGGRGRSNWGGGWFAPPVYTPYANPSQYEPINQEQEIAELKTQAKYFRDALGEIEKRLDEIKNTNKETP